MSIARGMLGVSAGAALPPPAAGAARRGSARSVRPCAARLPGLLPQQRLGARAVTIGSRPRAPGLLPGTHTGTPLPQQPQRRQGQRQRQQPAVCQAAWSAPLPGRESRMSDLSYLPPMARKAYRTARRVVATVRSWSDNPTVRMVSQLLQFVLAIVFVALYVLATYSPPAPGSPRYKADIFLCALFAGEYVHRMLTAESKLRMLTSVWNVCDLLSFAPPLLETLLRATGTSISLGGVDLRWVKILRSMRVLRVGLLSGELRSLHLSTRKGGFLTSGTNFRLFQLICSVFILLFTTSSIIQIVERMPFHQAIYLVVTTLTTVGFGDVVAQTMLGRAVIITTICFGVVAIPVQAAQLYAEFTARRVVRGSLPSGDWRSPMVLLSTRLTEVRAFSDFYYEFQQALKNSPQFPTNTKMLVLCNRPSYEFGAFQELHERRITFMEGSAVSGQDLVHAHAERARACLLLADRFTTDPEQEDLSILFQVWAMKSYTKTVPLYVQTVRQATVQQIAPFLDPGQDVVFSMEQTRMRLLALSAVCPGASTLIGNLLKSATVRPLESMQRTLAGRQWLRAYVNGCAYQFLHVAVPQHLVGRRFMDVALWLFVSAGKVLIGLIDEREQLLVNPADMGLPAGATLIVVATSKKLLGRALKKPYSRLPVAEVERLTYLPQELAREAAMKAGGGNSGSEDWLLETLDAADAAALGDTVSAAVAGSSREAAAAAAGGDGIAAPGRSGSSSRGSMGGANGSSSSSSGGSKGRSSGNGSGSGSSPGAESQEVEVCVPLLVGNPDSDSLDADSVPCVPAELASRLTTPAAVKAFVAQYQKNKRAQQEQEERGSITRATAEAMAAEATAAVAAQVAAGGSTTGASWRRGGSIDLASSNMLLAAIGPQALLLEAPPRLQRPVSLRDFAPACRPSCATRLQFQRPGTRARRPALQPRLTAVAAAAWSDSASDDDMQPGSPPQPPSSPAHQVQRALGLDYGRRVVGLAVSTLGFAPRPLDGLPGCTVHEQMALAASVLEVAWREGCDAIVVGLPVTTRGDLRQRDTDSQQGRRCRNFAHNLAAAAAAAPSSAGGSSSAGSLFKSSGSSGRIRVFLSNEQGSTMQARQELAASGRRKAVVSKVKDSVAAAVILKSFFEDPGAALLVRAARPRMQQGSKQERQPEQQPEQPPLEQQTL